MARSSGLIARDVVQRYGVALLAVAAGLAFRGSFSTLWGKQLP